MVNLERQNRQPVDGPRRGLGIEPRTGQWFYLPVFVEQVRIDVLHHVRTLLIGLVDAPFDGQRGHGVDLRIADDILKMPLHGVDPVLVIEQVIDRSRLIGILDGTVHIVPAVILFDNPVENAVCVFGKHSSAIYFNCNFRGKIIPLSV